MRFMRAKPEEKRLAVAACIKEVAEISNIVQFVNPRVRHFTEKALIPRFPNRIFRPARITEVSGAPCLSRVADCISALCELLRKHFEFRREVTAVRSRFFELPDMKTCQQRGTRRTTLRRCDKCIVKQHALPCNTVECGCLKNGMPVRGSMGPRLIVG